MSGNEDVTEASKALEQDAEIGYRIRTALNETSPWFMCTANGHVEIAKVLLEYQEVNEVKTL